MDEAKAAEEPKQELEAQNGNGTTPVLKNPVSVNGPGDQLSAIWCSTDGTSATQTEREEHAVRGVPARETNLRYLVPH